MSALDDSTAIVVSKRRDQLPSLVARRCCVKCDRRLVQFLKPCDNPQQALGQAELRCQTCGARPHRWRTAVEYPARSTQESIDQEEATFTSERRIVGGCLEGPASDFIEATASCELRAGIFLRSRQNTAETLVNIAVEAIQVSLVGRDGR